MSATTASTFFWWLTAFAAIGAIVGAGLVLNRSPGLVARILCGVVIVVAAALTMTCFMHAVDATNEACKRDPNANGLC